MYNIYKLEVSLLINHVESRINQKLDINNGLKFFHTSLQMKLASPMKKFQVNA